MFRANQLAAVKSIQRTFVNTLSRTITQARNGSKTTNLSTSVLRDHLAALRLSTAADDAQKATKTPTVCVIGSGPSACYTAKYILKDRQDVKIDVIERLPTPFGLVRFGVAPDHPEVKVVLQDFTKSVFEDPRVQFCGNVAVDQHVTVPELRAAYDAVVVATGAAGARHLGIEGEDSLVGVYDARDFVNWYNGHPDHADADFMLDQATDVVIIGNGNVALDVARILIRDVKDLEQTDIPANVLEKLAKSQVENVYVVGRRGPAQAAWTIPEFREITTYAMRPVHVPPRSRADASSKDGKWICGLRISKRDVNEGYLDPSSGAVSRKEAESNRAVKRKTDLLLSLCEKAATMDAELGAVQPTDSTTPPAVPSMTGVDVSDPSKPKPVSNDRVLHLNFLARPVALRPLNNLGRKPGEKPVLGEVVFERTRLAGSPFEQKTSPTGELYSIPDIGSDSAERRVIVFTSVGYRTLPLEGVPFDHRKHVLPSSVGGMVLPAQQAPGDSSDTTLSPVYVAGWAKRGPTGTIGSNIADARETADGVLQYLQQTGTSSGSKRDELREGLWNRIRSKTSIVSFDQWKLIDSEEIARGEQTGRPRAKVSTWSELLKIAQQKKE